jgi:hypothetical protein
MPRPYSTRLREAEPRRDIGPTERISGYYIRDVTEMIEVPASIFGTSRKWSDNGVEVGELPMGNHSEGDRAGSITRTMAVFEMSLVGTF